LKSVFGEEFYFFHSLFLLWEKIFMCKAHCVRILGHFSLGYAVIYAVFIYVCYDISGGSTAGVPPVHPGSERSEPHLLKTTNKKYHM
jgi:hypothetical protein